jgi:hypothetical protein
MALGVCRHARAPGAPNVIKYLILGGVVAATLVLLVDPTRQAPMETVDTVAGCVDKYWRGRPIDQWTVADHMDAACRALLQEAKGAR